MRKRSSRRLARAAAARPSKGRDFFPYGEILAEIGRCMVRINRREILGLSEAIACAGRIFLAGAGRSGLVARMFAVRLTHLGRQVHVLGESTAPACGARDLLVIVSGSGRTGGLLHLPERAHRVGTRVALITADPDSPLAAGADLKVTIPARSGERGKPASTQFAGSLFEQCALICLEALVLDLMRKLRQSEGRMAARHQNLE
ncbi:MAG: SIS domain-containing protein [Planctomycetota bacterium]|nr:SIS domain-containing protein [Planctomycetota bacterium]